MNNDYEHLSNFFETGQAQQQQQLTTTMGYGPTVSSFTTNMDNTAAHSGMTAIPGISHEYKKRSHFHYLKCELF